MRAGRGRARRILGSLVIVAAVLVMAAAYHQATGGSTPPVAVPTVPVTEVPSSPSPMGTTEPPTVDPTPSPSTSPSKQPVKEKPRKRTGQPIRVDVKGVISAPIVPMRPDEQEMVPPGDPDVVGWWPFYRPDQSGTVVLAAHATSDATVGALEHIDRLRTGDRIDLTVKGGNVFHYRVREVRAAITKPSYAKLADRIFADRGGELVLVTSARYDPSRRQWYGNDVVFAALVE